MNTEEPSSPFQFRLPLWGAGDSGEIPWETACPTWRLSSSPRRRPCRFAGQEERDGRTGSSWQSGCRRQIATVSKQKKRLGGPVTVPFARGARLPASCCTPKDRRPRATLCAWPPSERPRRAPILYYSAENRPGFRSGPSRGARSGKKESVTPGTTLFSRSDLFRQSTFNKIFLVISFSGSWLNLQDSAVSMHLRPV
jgi:hypothetical protein